MRTINFLLSNFTFVMMFKSFVPHQWDHSVSGEGGYCIPVGLYSKGSVANCNARLVLMMLRPSARPDNKARQISARFVPSSF